MVSAQSDPTGLRTFVQDNVGGRDVLRPMACAAGLLCTRCSLSIAIAQVEQERIDYSRLDALLDEEDTVEHEEHLYDMQRRRGLQ